MNTYEEDKKQLHTEERRMCPRMKCEVDANFTTATYKWPCKIVDVSEYGLGIIMTKNISRGVVVQFGEPPTKAEVVWKKESRVGLKLIYAW
jgi:hypothetical protein